MEGSKPEDSLPTTTFLNEILAAEQEHGPAFNKQRFTHVYQQYRNIKHSGGEYTALDIFGHEHTLKCSTSAPGDKAKLCIAYKSLQHMATPVWRWTSDWQCPVAIRRIDHGKRECSEDEAFRGKMREVGLWWEGSQYRSKIEKHVEKYGEEMERVDRIVCFGLGCPLDDRVPVRLRPFAQYLAAHTLRDCIARVQGHRPKVFAQDPVLCAAGIEYLRSQLDIEAVDDEDGIELLDGNTFVMSFAPNVPIKQIAVQMTDPAGGPAGMFCNSVRGDGLDVEGHAKTDPDSPYVWKYREESMGLELGRDERDLFGECGVYLKKRRGVDGGD